MRRIWINLAILGALLAGALFIGAPLGAQQPDSALASRTRTDCQYVLTRDKSAPGYSKQRLAACVARMDSIIALHKTPLPPPPPPPPDSEPVVVNDSAAGIAMRAELPRVTPAFAVPAPVRSYRIGANLQTALDTARAGDELRLSGIYPGNFVQRGCGNGWITIRSNAADSLLPPAGVRLTPTYAPYLPAIQTPNSQPALTVYGCNVKILGVEITATATAALRGVGLNYGLLWLGDGGETQTSLDKVPQNIWLDRVWVHGQDSTSARRCIALNSGATVIANSTVENCHAAGFDAQAIGGWNGPGPYLIENNELVGSTENVMFGGGDPAITGLSPSDITIRRNHIHKDPRWRGVWSAKNLLELKNARRVLIEDNVFETTWPDAQQMAIVIKSSQDSCGTCLWEGTQDVTLRWNIVRRSPGGLNIQGYDESGQVKTTTHTARVTVEHNAFTEIGGEGAAQLMLLTHDLADILIASNVFLHAAPNRGSAITCAYAGGAARRLSFTGNVVTIGNADNGGVIYDGGLIGTAAFNAMVGDGSWWFAGNQVVGGAPLASRFPPGNTFPDTVPALDLGELQRRTAGVVVAP
jgi:hypothetical protein